MKALLRLIVVGVAFVQLVSAVASAQDGVYFPDYGPDHHAGGGPFLTSLHPTFPGRMWLGYSAVNNGLGYGTGGYFTLGAKTRMGEDYLGGRWLLEGRGHLAHEQGNVFANLGIERIFTIEPARTDVGFSIWFDADGDRERHFGHSFEQIGISGFLRHEHFEIRSNGYIPLGDTGFRFGNPDDPCFFRNLILVQHGIDTALEGFDVELRLNPYSWHMFQGSIDVGGYYYQDADEALTRVDSFAGVRVRASLQTLRGIELQAELNQDTRFDTTAFFRVVINSAVFGDYDFLGRDLNPTIRNDHVVKFHQDPIVLIDPRTGRPYRVIHVDSSNPNPGGGNGTAESPFTTLAAADGTLTANSRPFDVIFVREGVGPYDEIINLLNGQFLLGDGVAHNLASATGGFFTLCNDVDGNIPDINGVVLGGNNIVRGFNITPASPGITTPLDGLPDNVSTIVDQVQITGGSVGVNLVGENAGSFLFTDSNPGNTVGMSITNATITGFNVDGTLLAAGAHTLDIDYNGTITSTLGTAINITNLPAGSPAVGDEVTFSNGIINVDGGNGFVANTVGANVTINSFFDQDGGVNGIDIQSSAGTFRFNNADITNPTGTGVSVLGGGIFATALVYNGNVSKNNVGRLVNIDGVINNVAAGLPFDIDFLGGRLAADGTGTGIRVANVATGTTLRFSDVDIGIGSAGGTALTNDAITLLSNNVGGNAVLTFGSLDVVTSGGIGLNSNNGGTINVGTGSLNSTGALGMNVLGTTAGTGGVNLTNVTVNNSVGGGLNLQNNTGTWNLGAVAVTNTGGTGINAASAGTLTMNGTINTTTGTGLAVTDTLLNGNFTNISSSSAPGSGITISNLTGTSTFAVTGGVITGSGANAVDVINGSNFGITYNISGLNITFGSTDGLRGINLDAIGLPNRVPFLDPPGDNVTATIANNQIDLNGTASATGIFLGGNDGVEQNLDGSGNVLLIVNANSINNTVTAITGAGSVEGNFNNGLNIKDQADPTAPGNTGKIQLNGSPFP